jgi:hypothetical protein
MSLHPFRFQPQRERGDLLAISIALALLLVGCLHPRSRESGFRIYVAEMMPSVERYCAWYGDARDGVLYFGTAAFWSAMRANGNDPMADLLEEGPVAIGRFDLRGERMLEPIQLDSDGHRSGVWDVLAHPNGRIYFTTFYESAGYTDVPSGEFARFPNLGTGLNELALGPDESVLASRYGSAFERDGSGSVVSFDTDGTLLAEFPLRAPEGYRVAPKTVAFDPVRGEIWVTTDLLALDPEDPQRHDAYLLSERGEELLRISEPEIQFVAFAADGTGYRAEVEGRNLWLRVGAPGEDPEGGRRILLDAAFAPALDFVQDIAPMPDGRAVVSRWSGWVHVVDSPRRVHSTRLPQFEDGGLYYSAVAEGDRICATYCSEVSVVCRDIP